LSIAATTFRDAKLLNEKSAEGRSSIQGWGSMLLERY
jgi:hypothetical protein